MRADRILGRTLALTFGVAATLAAIHPAGAGWRAHEGWGPFPPPYPYNADIQAGVAAGVAGVAAGTVMNNVLGEPQQQPYSPPSSVYIAPPSVSYNAPPSPPAVPGQPLPDPIIHAGSYAPATGAARWDPDCNAPVAPSGVYINGVPLGPQCQ